MGYIIAALAVIVGVIFWWTQKQTRRQQEWRRNKELEIIKKRARIAEKNKAPAKPRCEEE